MSRYLGIDVGSKNIGISYSSENGAFAFPHSNILRDGCVVKIDKIAKEKDVTNIVLGLSVDLSNKDNVIMGEVRDICTQLSKRGYKTHFSPEWYTTQGAHEKKHSGAATIILQSFLDKLRGV